jgi:hypothetical protein
LLIFSFFYIYSLLFLSFSHQAATPFFSNIDDKKEVDLSNPLSLSFFFFVHYREILLLYKSLNFSYLIIIIF